jgi:hypothetical protein
MGAFPSVDIHHTAYMALVMADEQPLSQNDIDALIASVSGGAAPNNKPNDAASAPSDAAKDAAKNPGTKNTNKKIEEKSAPASAASAGPLDQSAIDALIAQAQGTTGSIKKPDIGKNTKSVEKPAAPSASLPTPLTAAAGPLDQSAIDDLFAQAQSSLAATPAPNTKTTSKPGSGNSVTKANEKPAQSAPPAGPLDQSAIDALLAEVQGSPGSTSKPGTGKGSKPAESSVKKQPTEPMDQSAIDALFAQAAGTPGSTSKSGTGKSNKPAENSAKKSDDSSAAGPMDQSAIDALFAQTAGTPGSTSKPGTGKNTPPAAAPSVSAASASHKLETGTNTGPGVDEGPLGQDDIDKLLAALGGSSEKSVPASAENPSVPTTSVAEAARSQTPGTTSSASHDAKSINEQATIITDPNATVIAPPAGTDATLSLSPDDLDALVERQVGTVSDHQEAPMIDQADIDALVKQLAQATGAPDTKRISDALAQHEGEIDKLLEQAGGGAKVTLDAVPVSALNSASTGTNRRTGSTMNIPVMAPSEIKGTRYLLAAAVLFLAMCATTLGMVVHAIQGLSLELKKQHAAQLIPSDNFADDFKAALAQLHAPDAADAAKGALFLQRLKKNYPSHEGEIALALAKHFRATGSLRQASEEFSGLAEINLGLFDDPRLYLDYAACLVDLNDITAATKQVYRLLANENLYTGTIDRHGLTRPADEVARNKQALQDAYLTLGRLLAHAWGKNDTQSIASLDKNSVRAEQKNTLTLPHSSAHGTSAGAVSAPSSSADHSAGHSKSHSATSGGGH